jgi:hypothetical protein
MVPEPSRSDQSIETRLLPIARRLWPELATLTGLELTSGVADVFGLLYSAPFALGGIGWLIAVTDLAVIRSRWPVLLILLILVALLRRLEFVLFVEVRTGTYADWRESLATIVTWSAALLFGPSGLWLIVLWALFGYAYRYWRAPSTAYRWNRTRNFFLELTGVTAGLVALALYRWSGGVFPLPGLALAHFLPALYATLAWIILSGVSWLPLFFYFGTSPAFVGGLSWDRMSRYMAIAMALPGLIDPFAILAAGLYAQMGVAAYLFFAAGLLLVGLLSRQLSKFAVRSRQRSRELEKLEQLGRAMINAPPDASTLPQVLGEHVPGMFSDERMEIRIFPDQTVYRHPLDRPPLPEPAWQWLHTAGDPVCFLPGSVLPWDDQRVEEPLVTAPILDVDSAAVVGGICLFPGRDVEVASTLLPAVQSLAAQVGSALHGARVCKVQQELALAWQIQSSFLPRDLPDVMGWQVAAALEPARQTSGDFYDVIPLPNGRLGVVVADVADKGLGAALYMALSRTLIRTYALQYHARPDYVLRVANRRILMDSDAKQFVTVFYGVLDPLAGTLTYCNAGHNPPYLLSAQSRDPVQELGGTGIPLGIFEGETWGQASVQIRPGDVLFVYSDGITDAEDDRGEFFGEKRLLDVARSCAGHSAQEAQETVLGAVHQFVGDAPQFDDITLMIVARNPET